MSAIDDVLGKKSPVDDGENSTNGLLALIAAQKEHFESIQPVEVDVMLGDQPTKLVVPFVWPSEFADLADLHPPRRSVASDIPLWFDLDAVTGSYPGVTAMVDGAEDDLIRVRDNAEVYCWPELYEVLSPEDRQSTRMAVWALHVWEPEQRRRAAVAKGKEVANG